MRIATFVLWGSLAFLAGCGWGGGETPPKPVPVDPWAGLDESRNAFIATSDPLNEPVTKVVYLPQNWSARESVAFYFTPQGSQLIPYDWFLALEQPDSNTSFRDTKNILRYRYLPQNKGPMNPDGLPVGFVGGEGSERKWLGMTCAACHTNEIRYKDTGYRVDGAPTHADVQGFLSDMVASLQKTHDDSAKFDRFAKAVLATKDTAASRAELKAELAKSIKIRVGYNLRNFVGFDPKQTGPSPLTHYGRLDAVDSIVNEVYWRSVRNPDLNNPTIVARPADALVSYPFLWDTPQSDLVEWLGVAKSGGPGGIFSLSRNTGEVLGVFGDFEIPDPPSTFKPGYPSSVKFAQLKELEALMTTLWSPLWPSDFPKIDEAAAKKGEALFRAKLNGKPSCQQCHAVIKRDDPKRKVIAKMDDVGTDTRAYENFFNPTRPSGKLEGVNVNFVPLTETIEAKSGAGPMITNATIGVLLGFYKDAPPDELKDVTFSGLMTKDLEEVAPYKGRSLNGIWATAPYLHNGSVPTLDALLRPAKDRPKEFSVGVRTFDPVKVGFLTEVEGFPKFRVIGTDGKPITGCSNAGHEYGAGLNDEQRAQLIEYLKSL